MKSSRQTASRSRTMSLPRPHLVPKPLWGVSAAKLLKSTDWRQIRATVLERYRSRCVWCGVRLQQGMICHEIWAYDDKSCIATLTGFELHCRECDLFCHIGFASARGLTTIALSHASLRFGYTKTQLDKIIKAASSEWETRSKVRWKVAIAGGLLEQFPALAQFQRWCDGLLGSPTVASHP